MCSCLQSKIINTRNTMCGTINLPAVLYGCKASSDELHRMKEFENGVLRCVSGMKQLEATGDLQRGTLRLVILTKYYSMITSTIRLSGHVEFMWEKRNVCRVLVGRTDFMWKS
jgi:hypothetical protein